MNRRNFVRGLCKACAVATVAPIALVESETAYPELTKEMVEESVVNLMNKMPIYIKYNMSNGGTFLMQHCELFDGDLKLSKLNHYEDDGKIIVEDNSFTLQV